jgi:proteasome assembly chaperone (PAC2) family protein
MQNNSLIWFEKPVLVSPYILMAFTGWANAGEVPTSALWYLVSQMDASIFAEMKPENYYTFQNSGSESKRPVVNIEDGIVQSYSIMTTNFWYHQGGPAGQDIIFVSGPEPDQNWDRYCDILLNMAQEYEARRIITLGGTFDAIPHTAPMVVTGAVSLPELKSELTDNGVGLTNYSGPSSIHSLFLVNASKRGLPMINLWSHTPHYIQVTDYMSCYGILVKLRELLDIKIDLDAARKDSEYLYSQVDEAIEKKPELQEYLKTLEEEYEKGKSSEEKPISKNVLKEIEDLFKNKQ